MLVYVNCDDSGLVPERGEGRGNLPQTRGRTLSPSKHSSRLLITWRRAVCRLELMGSLTMEEVGR